MKNKHKSLLDMTFEEKNQYLDKVLIDYAENKNNNSQITEFDFS